MLNWLVVVLAVTSVDFFYILLAIFGIWELLKKNKIKNIFGIISSFVLIIFGIIIIKDIFNNNIQNIQVTEYKSLATSFLSVFFLTISSPLTIIFFTNLFTTKAIEYNYTKNDLYIFWIATWLATPLFIWSSVLIFSLLKENIPVTLIQFLNIIVWILLILYGSFNLIKILKKIK